MKTETLHTALLAGQLLSALALALCLGVDLLTLTQIRGCRTPNELENVTRAIRLTTRTTPAAIVVLAATCIGMAIVNNEYNFHSGWVIVMLIATSVSILDGWWSKRRMTYIYSKARDLHIDRSHVQSISHGVKLLRHAWVRVAVLAGLAIIMAAKPGLLVSLGLMAGIWMPAALFAAALLPTYDGAWHWEDRMNVGG